MIKRQKRGCNPRLARVNGAKSQVLIPPGNTTRVVAGIQAHFRKPHSHSCGYLSFLDRFWSHKKQHCSLTTWELCVWFLPSTHASKSIEHAAIYHVTCWHFRVSPALARVSGALIQSSLSSCCVTRVGAGKRYSELYF